MIDQAKHKLNLDRPAAFQIKVPGVIEETWEDWYDGLTVTVESDEDGSPVSTLVLTVDQAALQGLLRRLYSLGIPLISVVCMEYS